jgi:hypothetical protein
MTAAKELAARELHENRNTYLEHVHDLAIERDALTAEKELAERTLTMCLHWAEKDAALYEETSAPEEMKNAIRHRVTVIREAMDVWSRAEAKGGK